MREDDNNPFRQSPGDGQERLWLRQSATFTVNGQTRTVEIALPVRPGAPADEVEALLDEADAGMRRLARRLDAHVAEVAAALTSAVANPPDIMGAASVTSPLPASTRHVTTPAATTASATPNAATPAPMSSAPASPRPSTSPARTLAEAPFASPIPAAPPAPAAQTSPAGQPPAQAPAVERPAPSARQAASGPSPTAPPPSTPPPATHAATPAQPTRAEARATPAPATSAPAANAPTPTVAAPASTGPLNGPELTIAEFLAAAKTLGFNPKQAMDTLNVRSLNGLNLREALAVLQRQSLGDDAMSAPASAPSEAPRPKAGDIANSGATPRSAPRPASAPAMNGARPAAPAAQPRPAPRPAYGFDEEDEPDLTFDLPDEPDDDFGAPYPTSAMPAPATPAPANAPDDAATNPPYAFDDLDDLDELEDLDDLDDLHAPGTYAPALSVPAEESSDAVEPGAADDVQAPARRIIARLRTARGGGAPVQQQRMAYRNIVIAQLGEQMATALIRGVWRITPDRLGPEQLDALIHWGKEDAFADEVVLALAALEDERATQSAAPTTPGAPAQAATGEQPSPRPAARPATRQAPTRAAPRQADDADGAPAAPPTRARAPRT